MSASQSCLVPWKACKIPLPRGPDNSVQPCKLEFSVIGPNGDEDRPQGAASYVLPGAGGYRLAHGTLRPFPQACQAPIMLVRAMLRLLSLVHYHLRVDGSHVTFVCSCGIAAMLSA
jgi:hypothetical protein